MDFSHAGDYGDLVYCLPAIRSACGGNLTLFPCNQNRTRAIMDERHAAGIIPLLREGCPYLSSVHWQHHPQPSAINDFRYKMRHDNNITDWAFDAIGIQREATPAKWLWVDADHKADVIVSRSARYHNEAFPWRRIVETYHDQMMFVGMKSDFEKFAVDFCEGYNVTHLICDNLLDVARVLAGAKLFVGNQSCPLAIAEGVKVPRIIAECWPENPNCRHERLGRQNWLSGELQIEFPKTSIQMISYADDGYSHYRDVSFPNKKKYCEKWGYEFAGIDFTLDFGVPASYCKIQLLKHGMRECPGTQWFHWTDADSVILRHDVPLEYFIDKDADLVIAHDNCGINCGQFLIRNCAESYAFLSAVWDRREQFRNHEWWEQGCIQEMVRKGETLGMRIKVIPQHEFNQYPQHIQGNVAPFCLHVPGRAMTEQQRVDCLKNALKGVGL